MESNNRIDDSLIKEVVFGRVKPKIYAFETERIPKYLKVGDTFRSVDERLNEWSRFGFHNLCKVGDWSSEIPEKDLYFRDYSVHTYLVQNGKERLTRTVCGDRPFSNEFFKNASREDVSKAIKEIISQADCQNSQYVYYSVFDHTAIDERHFIRDKKDWDPRKPLQTDAIDNFRSAIQNGRNNLLMYAVMRFGKSFTSLYCAKEMNAKLVLVVSGKADVAIEWQENVERPKQFENFVFLNTKKLQRNDRAISDAQKEGKTIVLFLTLQDLAKEKRRFAELFSQTIDLMIIDETHFAARADTLGRVIRDSKLPDDFALFQQTMSDGIKDDSLSSVDSEKAQSKLKKESKDLTIRAKLHLSGTPYRILLGSEFEPEDRVSFCQYSDIIEQKEKWYEENIAGNKQEETGKEEWDNPYYGFPEMIRFAFNLNDSAKTKIQQLEDQGYTSKLSALFAPKSVTKNDKDEHKQFVYKQEVLDFLQTIDGSKNDKNVLSFLDNERIKNGELCHHIVMVLPFCASCDAMEALIKENNSLFKNLNDYEIINISGIDTAYKKISEVKNKISDCERGKDSSGRRKTLTLTVNRMLTGCTVPEWDTMIFLKDTASPQDYDQAIFRLQSQFVVEYKEKNENGDNGEKKTIKKDMKPQTLLVDFDPQRMFYLQETKSRIYNINTNDGGNDESEKRIEKELKISPVLHISGNKLVRVQPNDILKAVSEYSTNRGITEAANDIIVDETMMNVEEIRTIIDREFEIGSGKGLAEQVYSGGETDLDENDIKSTGTPEKNDNEQDESGEKPEGENTSEKNQIENGKKVFVKKCRSYFRRILFYAFLCKFEKEIKNLKEVVESIEYSENSRIFDNLGMNKDFILLMQNKMNGTAKRSLDDKIYDLYRLSHEYEQDNNDPIKRATTAIQKFGKISDAEVVTPQKIAKEMIEQIPEKDFIAVFDNGNKFLDIASKMGEFAVAIYKRAEALSIPKDKICNSIYSIPTSKLAYEFTRFVYEKLGMSVKNISENCTSYDLLKVKDENDKIDYEKICSIVSQKRLFNEILINSEIVEGDEKVNFDVVVGNPPYQENIGTAGINESLGKQLFPHFMKLSMELSSKYSSMIVPSKWFTAKAQDGSFLSLREYVWTNNHFEKITNYLNGKEVFDDVNTGSVMHYLTNINHNGSVCFTDVQKGKRSVLDRPLFENGLDVVIPMNSMISILHKIIDNNFISFESLVTGRNPFGIPATDRELLAKTSEKPDMEHGISVLCAFEVTRYISRMEITRNRELIDTWKVCTAKINGGAGTVLDGKPVAVLGKTFVLGKNQICSNTLLAIGSFETKNQALNLEKYMNSKFFRFMLGVKKNANVLTSNVYSFVPMQNFTDSSDVDWSKTIAEIDKQLYDKYGLTMEERAFIESTIKPME